MQLVDKISTLAVFFFRLALNLKKIVTVFSEKEMIINTTVWLDMCFSYGSGDFCGSRVNFGDTIPASSFMRQTEGPTFYVNQGLNWMRDMALPCRDVKEWICCLPHGSHQYFLIACLLGRHCSSKKTKFIVDNVIEPNI